MLTLELSNGSKIKCVKSNEVQRGSGANRLWYPFMDKELGAFAEKQIVEAITTVRFQTGDIIFDWLGNKYVVVYDENRPIANSGVIPHYKIRVKDENDNEKEILNTSVSLWF